MKKWLRNTLIVVAILIIGLFTANAIRQGIPRFRGQGFGPSSEKTLNENPFIVANPLDLTQIKALSKFRSCVGHNYSGRNTAGEKEINRSMKHYIEPLTALAETSQQVKIFAPFDGKIEEVRHESRGSQVHIQPINASSGWRFIFFHVDLLPQFNQEGTSVTGGQHIGYGNLVQGHNFDIGLKHFSFNGQIFASPFQYMTETVLAQYAAVDITPDTIITTKAERDASPCRIQPGSSGRDAFFVSTQNSTDWVELH